MNVTHHNSGEESISPIFQEGIASSPNDLKWLHNIETVECEVEGKTTSYDIEDFGDIYDENNTRALADIDAFLDTHNSQNLDIRHFLLNDILHPLEYTLRCGVRDMTESEQITKLRRVKAIFFINQVLPRVYHNKNFAELQDTISRAITGVLVLIAELSTVYSADKEDIANTSTFFKTKEFLSSVALQIVSVWFCEEGVPLVENRTIPYLRQLAMMDILDENWNYAGGWEELLKLLEERHGVQPRIAADKALDESTTMMRQARNSIRLQILELEGPKASAIKPREMYTYFPKCSAYMCSEIETADKPHRLRCYQCHYYHWCSPACQQYSEEVADHHEIFCKHCPEEKAEECREQMRYFFNIPPVDEDEIKCHACGLLKRLSKSMNRCSKCKAVHYCSRTCQVWDWTNGDHRSKCSPL